MSRTLELWEYFARLFALGQHKALQQASGQLHVSDAL